MIISIITASYNRANFLRRIAQSIAIQEHSDIEWIIVDDGSVDDTAKVVAELTAEFPSLVIRYIYKPNGGKHTAINVGAREARGQYSLMLDSDDYIAPDGLQNLREELDKIKERDDLAALLLLRVTEEGKLLGSVPAEAIEGTYRKLFLATKILTGDYAWCFRTEALRQYPFPEFENERFLTESVMFCRMSGPRNIRFVNKALQIGNYESGGLSDRFKQLSENNPLGMMLRDKEQISYSDLPIRLRIYCGLRYWKYYKLAKRPVPALAAPSFILNFFRPLASIILAFKK